MIVLKGLGEIKAHGKSRASLCRAETEELLLLAIKGVWGCVFEFKAYKRRIVVFFVIKPFNVGIRVYVKNGGSF